jgi:hypothetical protein
MHRGVAVEGACELPVNSAEDTYKALTLGLNVSIYLDPPVGVFVSLSSGNAAIARASEHHA